jgi:sec-independent protein translocase protein TatB
MFDISWSELLLIGIVALIVIGPKELPGALRTLGQWMAKIRRMASEFQGQFQDAMREAELAELRKEVEDMHAQSEKFGQFDPLEDVRKDIEKSFDDLDNPATGTPASETAAADASQSDQPQLPLPEPAPAGALPASATPEPAITDAKPDPGRAPA